MADAARGAGEQHGFARRIGLCLSHLVSIPRRILFIPSTIVAANHGDSHFCVQRSIENRQAAAYLVFSD
jgi:hypothetical protein